MTYFSTLKRAARFNPAWLAASVYRVAVDGTGAAILDAAGEFQFDLAELTYAVRDYTSEDLFTRNEPYDGDAKLIIITEADPDPDSLILWDGIFYTVLEVLGGDAMGGTVKYRVKALPNDHVVPIRDNTL